LDPNHNLSAFPALGILRHLVVVLDFLTKQTVSPGGEEGGGKKNHELQAAFFAAARI
jgi:hypothetical protein